MRGYAAIGLHRPKDPLNIGEALRAAGCFGAAMLAASGTRYRRSRTDTQAAHRHMPLLECDDLKLVLPFDCVPVAVDLVPCAKNIADYKHPERAFYIFGPEDGTLQGDILSWCRDAIYIPTRYCMNLSATVNVVLYDRAVKGKPC